MEERSPSKRCHCEGYNYSREAVQRQELGRNTTLTFLSSRPAVSCWCLQRAKTRPAASQQGSRAPSAVDRTGRNKCNADLQRVEWRNGARISIRLGLLLLHSMRWHSKPLRLFQVTIILWLDKCNFILTSLPIVTRVSPSNQNTTEAREISSKQNR